MTDLGGRLNTVFTTACRSAAEALLALSGQHDRIQDRCRIELLESALRRRDLIHSDFAQHLADMRKAAGE